jgi:hypothetical protein
MGWALACKRPGVSSRTLGRIVVLGALGCGSCGGAVISSATDGVSDDASVECGVPPSGKWLVCGDAVHDCCGETFPRCPAGAAPGGNCVNAGLCIDCASEGAGQAYTCSGGATPRWDKVSGSVSCAR